MRKQTWMLVLVLATMALVADLASAQDDVPKGAKIIDAAQVKGWIDQGKKVVIVDSRVTSEFKEGHLPTAINIPGPQMEQQKDKLPKDKAQPIVFYCNGWPECKKSHQACTKAIAWGYKEVYWFRDGVPGWQAKKFPLQ